MRSPIILSMAAIFLSAGMAFSQSSEREINKEFYKADAQISIVINYLPTGWTFSAAKDKFILTAADSAWVLEENMADSPAESKDARTNRIKTNGIKILPEVTLRYEGKWSPEKIQLAKIGNANIDDEIRKLPAKYKIQHLADTLKNSKFKTVYTATNDKDAKLIAQYEAEVKKLLGQRTLLPDFHSEKYSLFIEKITGAGDETHLVCPEAVSLQVYSVISTIREICGR